MRELNIDGFVKNFGKKNSIEDIHSLRTRTRELLSLISRRDALWSALKGIISRSNKIRDIDVFFEYYLASLPKRYIKKLNMPSIKERMSKRRTKELKKLHDYLGSLSLPSDIKLSRKRIKKASYMSAESIVSPYQKELHKYRIHVKERLYAAKNTTPSDHKKIKMLTKIKDVLGHIHDNINGVEMLKKICKKEKVVKKIKEFTCKQDAKLFDKFKKLDGKCREKKYI